MRVDLGLQCIKLRISLGLLLFYNFLKQGFYFYNHQIITMNNP